MTLDHRGSRAVRAESVYKVVLEVQVPLVSLAILVLRDLSDYRETLARLVSQDHKDHKALSDYLEILDFQGHREVLDQKVRRVSWVTLEDLVIEVSQEQQVQLVLPAVWEIEAKLASLVRLVLSVSTSFYTCCTVRA